MKRRIWNSAPAAVASRALTLVPYPTLPNSLPGCNCFWYPDYTGFVQARFHLWRGTIHCTHSHSYVSLEYDRWSLSAISMDGWTGWIFSWRKMKLWRWKWNRKKCHEAGVECRRVSKRCQKWHEWDLNPRQWRQRSYMCICLMFPLSLTLRLRPLGHRVLRYSSFSHFYFHMLMAVPSPYM